MKKKLLSLAIALLISLTLLTIPSFAAQDGNWYFTVENNEITITGYEEAPTGKLVIPSQIRGLPVVAIGDSAFEECSEITELVLPNTLQVIGSSAFHNCGGITRLNIPRSVTAIGNNAFNRTGITSIEIPNTVTSLGLGVFARAPLTSAKFESGIQNTGESTFRYCDQLKDVTLPKTIKVIGKECFRDCPSLKNITIPNSVEEIGIRAFSSSGLEEINIPDNGLTICEAAFMECDVLQHVTVPASVTVKGGYAAGCFQRCNNLKTATLAGTGDYTDMFMQCTSLEEVTIKEGVTWIGNSQFVGCEAIRTLYLPASLVGVDPNAFEACGDKLTDIYYGGTKEMWEQIEFPNGFFSDRSVSKDYLNSAIIHFAEVPVTPKPTAAPAPTPAPSAQPTASPAPSAQPTSSPAPTKTSFKDVPSGAYFADAVNWAVNKGITQGTSPTTFSPGAACTREQFVTFLWRANNAPEPKSSKSPFTDVKDPSAYSYKAILWAVENGITAGTSKTLFSPKDTCTRAQVATFLWRANGQPSVKQANPFKDVTSSSYYYDAVLWAVKNGITQGTSSDAFSPSAPCTRGQIVTFLYRAMK